MTTEGIIDKIEKILKTDMRYLLKGGFWLMIGQFFSSASAIVVAIAFANLLPKEVYGSYRYILSIFAILLIPTLTSMDTAVAQAVSTGNEGVFKAAFKEKIRWGILGVIASFGCSVYYFFNQNYEFSICFALIAIFIPLTESFDMYNAVLQGRQQFRTFTVYNSLTQILSAICSIAAAFYSKNVAVLVVIFVISNTILNFIFLKLTTRYQPLNLKYDPQTISYGKHLSVMDILQTTVGQLDKILVFHYLGATDLAIYTIAIAPPEQIKGLLKNISFLAMPRFAQRPVEDIQRNLVARLIKFGLIIIAGTAAYIFVAPYIYNVFLPQYSQSIFYSQLFSVSLVAGVLLIIPQSFMQAHKAKRQLYQYNVSTNIFLIAVLFPCIYFWGLMGAIIARIIARFFTLGASIFLAYRIKEEI